MLQFNPYSHLGKPIRDFEHFYGRKPELAKLTNDVRNGQCISVVGIRRIGKTSLVRQLFTSQVRSMYQLNDDILCVYVDCSAGLLQLPAGEVYAKIMQRICRELDRGDRIKLTTPKESLSYYDFEDYILDLYNADIKLVLVFDEFEMLAANSELGVDFFLSLRALHIEHEIAYVTVSQRPLIDLEFSEKEIFFFAVL